MTTVYCALGLAAYILIVLALARFCGMNRAGDEAARKWAERLKGKP